MIVSLRVSAPPRETGLTLAVGPDDTDEDNANSGRLAYASIASSSLSKASPKASSRGTARW